MDNPKPTTISQDTSPSPEKTLQYNKKTYLLVFLFLLIMVVSIPILYLLNNSKTKKIGDIPNQKQAITTPGFSPRLSVTPSPTLVLNPIMSSYTDESYTKSWNLYHVENLTFKLPDDFIDSLDGLNPGIYRLKDYPSTYVLLSQSRISNVIPDATSSAVFLNKPTQYSVFLSNDEKGLSSDISSFGLNTTVKSIHLEFYNSSFSVSDAKQMFEHILKSFSYDPQGTILITPTPLPNKIIWRPYTSKKNGYAIQYPWPILGYPKLDIDSNITTYSLAETKAAYENCGGPGQCSYFKSDLSRVDEQFALLSQVSQTPGCILSSELKEKISNNFKLLARGIETKQSINGVYNSELNACGIEYYGPDNYAVMPSAYYYKTAFYLNSKIVSFAFELFTTPAIDLLPKYDSLRQSLGMNGNSCDSDCFQKFGEYSNNINYKEAGVQEIVSVFRKMVSYFRFL